MDRRLTKAEILWTRKCPLACSFCAMPWNLHEGKDEKGESVGEIGKAPVEKMIEGLHKLREFDCKFIAIYGASPLYDMDGLGTYIAYAESIGISTTVITDGIVKNHREKLQELYDCGLRSLTVSYDFIPYDKSSDRKSQKGQDLIPWFIELPGVRDVEIVSTITKTNYRACIKQLWDVTLEGEVWFSFDIVHPDRGQNGSKCRGDAEGFMLNTIEIRQFARALLDLKDKGLRVHQSDRVLNYMINYPDRVENFKWNCAKGKKKLFPSWVTIDADGTVLPCDDFYTDRSFKVWDFDNDAYDKFAKLYYEEVKNKCPGCFWSTHYDAVEIKAGRVAFEDYIHEE